MGVETPMQSPLQGVLWNAGQAHERVDSSGKEEVEGGGGGVGGDNRGKRGGVYGTYGGVQLGEGG